MQRVLCNYDLDETQKYRIDFFVLIIHIQGGVAWPFNQNKLYHTVFFLTPVHDLSNITIQ